MQNRNECNDLIIQVLDNLGYVSRIEKVRAVVDFFGGEEVDFDFTQLEEEPDPEVAFWQMYDAFLESRWPGHSTYGLPPAREISAWRTQLEVADTLNRLRRAMPPEVEARLEAISQFRLTPSRQWKRVLPEEDGFILLVKQRGRGYAFRIPYPPA